MSEDLIRRSDAVNELAKFLGVPARAFIHEAEKLLKDVPSAQRKKGHWVGIDDEPCEVWECDVCGCVCEDWTEKPTYNFCPNCGADMREGSANDES